MMNLHTRLTMYARTSHALVLTTAALMIGCGGGEPPAMPQMPPPTVTVAQPEVETVTDYGLYSGLTRAEKIAEIRARVDGYLTSIEFEPGQRVEKGDLLFQIDPEPFAAKVEEMRATLKSSEASLALAEASYARKKAALEDNAISELSVLEAEAQRDSARASVAAAKAMLETAELDLTYASIRAPFTGRIGRHLVDEGNLIQVAQGVVLAELVADENIHVYFTVSEVDRMRYPDAFAPDTPVEMGLADEMGFTHRGRLDFIDPRVDRSTGSLEVRATFVNPEGEILSGQFARLRIPIETVTDALVVPEVALGTDQQGRYLLVVDENNTVTYRGVTLGPKSGGKRVITDGIAPADRVVVNGLQRAQPGMPVTPTTADANNPATAGNAATGTH